MISIQEWLTDVELPRDHFIQGILEAFGGDPEPKCLDRMALPRRQRALVHADEAGLAAPTRREMYTHGLAFHARICPESISAIPLSFAR